MMDLPNFFPNIFVVRGQPPDSGQVCNGVLDLTFLDQVGSIITRPLDRRLNSNFVLYRENSTTTISMAPSYKRKGFSTTAHQASNKFRPGLVILQWIA